MCKQGLKKLKNCSTSDNLVQKYDEIFKKFEQNKIFEKVPFDEVPQKPGQVHISRINGLFLMCPVSRTDHLRTTVYIPVQIYSQRFLRSYYGSDLTLLGF